MAPVQGLTLTDLTARRGKFRLGPVNYQFPLGVTAVLGVNGSGKTTLFESMLGLADHSGQVRWGASPRTPREAIGYVPQHPEHPRFVTADDCVRYAGELKGMGSEAVKRAAADALRTVDLHERRNEGAARLSGGQRRRLAIAQAIVHRPTYLILDEPTAGLDPAQRVRVRDLLASGLAKVTIVSTHIMEDVVGWAERYVVLSAGRVVDTFAAAELPATDPVRWLEQRLIELDVS